jgi:peptidoglycan/xylan/chitin deacetylase (PgdA/CDA1 family)
MFKRFLIAVGFFLLIVVLSAAIIFPRHYVVPILMYHSVKEEVPEGSRLTVSVKTFERQIRFLKERRYNVIPLTTAAQGVAEKRRFPPKTVVITFDDGFRDNFTHAFPVLKKYGLCATLFVILDEVGRPRGDRLSWEEIRIMRDSGLFQFGSHTFTEVPLVNIRSQEEVKRQIFDSKKALEEKLGVPVEAFSYPEGFFTPQIKEWVRLAGYKLAVATNPGKKIPDDDVFALKRLRISENASNLFVFWVESSGYYNYMRENRRK